MQVNNINYSENNLNFKSLNMERAEKILKERLTPEQFKNFKAYVSKKLIIAQ